MPRWLAFSYVVFFFVFPLCSFLVLPVQSLLYSFRLHGYFWVYLKLPRSRPWKFPQYARSICKYAPPSRILSLSPRARSCLLIPHPSCADMRLRISISCLCLLVCGYEQCLHLAMTQPSVRVLRGHDHLSERRLSIFFVLFFSLLAFCFLFVDFFPSLDYMSYFVYQLCLVVIVLGGDISMPKWNSTCLQVFSQQSAQ